MRAIYFVLESKRVDQSFEKLVSILHYSYFAVVLMRDLHFFQNNLHLFSFYRNALPVRSCLRRRNFGLEWKTKHPKPTSSFCYFLSCYFCCNPKFPLAPDRCRRKCIGRSRKQNADYAMLTGLPQLALDSYAASMDMLKSCNDMLWFAG